jgi:hypothetical protein
LRTFSKTFGEFVAKNPSFSVFLAGFLAFSGAVAWWSVPVAGVCSGAILMAIAAYPYISRKG